MVPLNASRNGIRVGRTIGRGRGTRVIWESAPTSSVTVSKVSPLTIPRAANRPRSPAIRTSIRWSRRERVTVARLMAPVWCMTPSAGTSSTRTSVTWMVAPTVSIVDELKPTCCCPTSSR